jgi:MFS family permease
MSNEAAAEGTSAGGTGPGALGVLATWRQMPRQVKALIAGVMVSKLAGFLQIFLILFLTHRGFSSGQAGLALGLWGAGVVVGTFTGGWLSDRLSARTAIVISMFGSAGLMVSLVYIRAYVLLLLAVFAVSTVNQLYRPASQSLIAEHTPGGQQVMVTSMYMLCFNVGIVVAPLIGTALASISYYLLFWTEGLGLLAFGLIALLALPRQPKAAPDPPAPDALTPDTPKPARGGYLAVLADWRYVTFLGAFLLISVVYVQYTAALPLSIKHAGLSMWWYGAVLSLNGIICATCQIPATRFIQKWPLLLVQLIGFGLLPLGYGIYAIAILPVLLIVGTVVWTIADMVGVPTMFAYPGMVAPAHLRGRYFAALQGVHGIGLSFGPFLGVLLLNDFGQRAWLWLAGLGILATVVGQVGLRRPAAADEAAPEPVEAEPVAS